MKSNTPRMRGAVDGTAFQLRNKRTRGNRRVRWFWVSLLKSYPASKKGCFGLARGFLNLFSIETYSLYFEMKPRNISFAEVLKKKGRSPQPEVSRSGLKLSELLEQWVQYPDEDYTLQLGGIGLSQRSRHSTIRMFCSKNNAEDQEEMFDSWIQRQSFVSSNKENIGTQPRRMQVNEPAKQQTKKIVLSSKGKEGKMSARTMGDLVRQAEIRQMEESSRGCQQVQMIKSNFSENQQPRISISHSPRALKPQQEEMQLQLEEITMKGPNFKQTRDKEGLRKELSKITEQKMQEANMIMEEPRKKMTREQLITDNEDIHNEIADMAKEIVRQNSYNREESEDEELLIGDSEKKPYMPQPITREPFFRGERAERQDNAESRRIQQARNVVGGVLKNFNMGRIGGASNKSSNAVSTEQLRIKTIEEPKNTVIPVHYEVGYSFASNMIDTQRDESLSDLQIQQIKSELPTPKMQESQDLQFRKKYLNNMPVVPDEHIKNIQSIRFQTQMHEDAINSMPNSSFEVQLINSEAKRYEDSYHIEPEKQNPPEIMVNLPYQYEESKSKQTVKEQTQSMQPAKLSFTNVFEQNYSSKQPYVKENTAPIEYREHISSYTSPKVIDLPLMASGSKYEMKGEDYYRGEPFSANIEPVSSKRDYQFEHETVEKIVQQMQSPKLEEKIETKDVTSPTSFKDIKASNSKYESFNSIKDIKESTPIQANPTFSSISIPKQQEPSLSQSNNNYSSPSYTQPVPSYLASYNQSSYAQNNYVSSPSNVPSYSNNYSTSTYQTGATYATYQPVKPYTSSKTYDYATPTPISTYTPTTFTSTYQPAKVDYISVPIKTDSNSSTSSIKSYEQKYTITSTTVAQPRVDKSDKFEKKNYLTQLDIKQSITLEQPKPKNIPLISKGIKSSFAKPEQSNPPSLFKQSLKQSIKQSINLNASGEAEEFQFDF